MDVFWILVSTLRDRERHAATLVQLWVVHLNGIGFAQNNSGALREDLPPTHSPPLPPSLLWDLCPAYFLASTRAWIYKVEPFMLQFSIFTTSHRLFTTFYAYFFYHASPHLSHMPCCLLLYLTSLPVPLTHA